ncbi:hypothetical protein AB0F46_40135 [Streptomyces sp. NPDC026665]|uniref:hypothetical protein n=1 Tax=Streptomyces sp. NPDC026665 TaxID=3154798 RepID=UPI0033E08265
MGFLSGTGKILGWGSCAEPTDQAAAACIKKKDIVGRTLDYLPVSQMSSMQWLGTSILLVLTAAIVVFIVLLGRRRLT